MDDLLLIEEQIKKGGFASLTQGQKDILSASKSGQDAFNSAVISSANIEEDVLPDLKADVDEFTQVGNFTDSEGVERDAVGRPIEERDENEIFLENLADFNRKFGRDSRNATGVKRLAGGFIDTSAAFTDEGEVIGGTRKPTQQEEDDDEFFKDQQIILNEMKRILDATTLRHVREIETLFDLRRQEQREINLRSEALVAQGLLVSGSSRYAQKSSDRIFEAKQSAGLREIMELDIAEQGLINQALASQEQGNFALLEKQLELAQNKRAEKQRKGKEVTDLLIKEYEELKEIRKAQDLSIAISSLRDQGITDIADVIEQLIEQGIDATPEEISKANDILNPPQEIIDVLTGTTADWKTYKRMKEEGEIPEDWDFFDYKDVLTNITKRPVVSEVPKLQPTEGFFDPKIETSVREDYNELLSGLTDPINPTDEEKDSIFTTLRRLYSPQEASDEALKRLIGIADVGITEAGEAVLPGAEEVASSWLEETITSGLPTEVPSGLAGVPPREIPGEPLKGLEIPKELPKKKFKLPKLELELPTTKKESSIVTREKEGFRFPDYAVYSGEVKPNGTKNIRADLNLKNDSGVDQDYNIKMILISPSGKEEATSQTKETLKSGRSLNYGLEAPYPKNPEKGSWGIRVLVNGEVAIDKPNSFEIK